MAKWVIWNKDGKLVLCKFKEVGIGQIIASFEANTWEEAENFFKDKYKWQCDQK